jgi:DTW domain-containing protein YfiP
VLHQIEASKPTNTGRLVSKMLRGSSCRIRGERGVQMDTSDFREPSRRTLVLFPSPEAQVLSSDYLAPDDRPIRLIVPDATWKQASRLSRKPELAHAVHVTLGAVKASTYRLRRHARAEALSTYEAVTEALCIIEGEHVRQPLENVFRVFVDRTLWSRGEMPASEVFGGISQAALQWKNSSNLPRRTAGSQTEPGGDIE